MLKLLNLPQEVLVNIFSQTDFSDYVTLCRVHFTFFQIFQANMSLKYQIACQIAGVVDNRSCNIPLHKRFEILKRVESGWHYLDFDFERALRVQRPSNVSILVDGFFIAGDADSPTTIRYFKLPSCGEESQLRCLGGFTLNGDDDQCIFHVDLDISQDLIAIGTARSKAEENSPDISTVEIHLLQFSTGEPHPLAQIPTFSIGSPESAIDAFRITGKYATIIASSDFAVSLSVLDWTTSKVRMARDIICQNCLFDMIFLSQSLVLVSNPKDAALELYTIPEQDDAIAHEPILTLRLPAAKRRYSGILCETETRRSRSCTPHSPQPYHNSFEKSVISFAISIECQEWTEVNYSFLMVVHRSALVDLCLQKAQSPGSAIRCQWKSWGPKVTRWFPPPGTTPLFITAASGQRCAVINHTRDRLTVLDFNPLNILRCLHAKKRGDTDDWGVNRASSVVTSTSFIRHNAFKKKIASSLPYKSISHPSSFYRKNIFPASKMNLYLDNERVVQFAMKEKEWAILDISHVGRKSPSKA
ncbi:hypothetical protein H0H93_012186 [Arthromyces matolae]|nr:hypothetical protein H0H93_012186 [Arthromyces matolae]